MGYTTDFSGQLKLSKSLTQEQQEFITAFTQTRRMGRDVSILMKTFKGKHGLPMTRKLSKEEKKEIKMLEGKFGLTIDVTFEDIRTAEQIYGVEGEYFVGDEKTGIIDYNTPPGNLNLYVRGENIDFSKVYEENTKKAEAGECQPGLRCQWEVVGDTLRWDGGEKFYSYIEWLKYLINRFFQPWGITLNGEIMWQGEETGDIGKIVVNDNVVKVLEATFVEK